MTNKEAIEIMKDWIKYEKANKNRINKADELIKIQETVLRIIDKKDNEIKELRRTSSAKEEFYKTYMEENKKLKGELDKYKEMYAVSVADRVNNAFKQKLENDEDLEMLYKGCQIELEEKDKYISKLENKLMYALSPTTHELALTTQENFKTIIRDNLEEDTYTIKRALKEYWEDK